MRNIRTCSHIKTNGLKCGSPALRHQTLCYFHYHWDRRERRRIRLGGPVGMNKNTGIELPILEGPESIMLAIMEVQAALLDARIDRLVANTLLYSLQLAMQLKIGSLCDRHNAVLTCPELDHEIELDRAKGLRPAKEICSSCPDLDTCTTPRTCSRTDETLNPGSELRVEQAFAPDLPSSRPERSGVEGPAVHSSVLPISGSSVAVPCHPERSPQGGVEGPFVSSPEARLPIPSPPPLKLETVVPKLQASVTPERKQKALRLRATPPLSVQGDTCFDRKLGTDNRELATVSIL